MYRGSSSASWVEADASLSQRTDNQSGIGSVVVDASCDQIELLVQASRARLYVDWNQVLTEVTCGWVDEETLTV